QQPRETVIEAIWPEDAPAAARHKLSVALSSLRRQLEPPGVPAGAVILADRFNVGLNPASVTTDVADFEAALRSAQASRAVDREELLARVVALYVGDLLPGYYEEWAVAEQRRLAERYLEALRQLAGCLAARGDLARALEHAQRALAADPLRE